MFNFQEILNKIDPAKIEAFAKNLGLSDEQSSKIANYAADALQYRVSKEKARGNEEKVASLLSEKPNTQEDEVMKAKVEGDFAYNLVKKLGLSDEIANKISKSDIVTNLLSHVSSFLSDKGENNSSGIVNNIGDNNLIDNLKKKFSGLFN